MSLLDRLFTGEHLILDARVRESLPGRTAWLTDGVTYYETSGPERGTPVILIHGLGGHTYSFRHTVPALEIGRAHV